MALRKTIFISINIVPLSVPTEKPHTREAADITDNSRQRVNHHFPVPRLPNDSRYLSLSRKMFDLKAVLCVLSTARWVDTPLPVR